MNVFVLDREIKGRDQQVEERKGENSSCVFVKMYAEKLQHVCVCVCKYTRKFPLQDFYQNSLDIFVTRCLLPMPQLTPSPGVTRENTQG